MTGAVHLKSNGVFWGGKVEKDSGICIFQRSFFLYDS